jgi:hypothetical protein
MEHSMKFMRACTVPLEIAHIGDDGVLHGHSLTVELWTDRDVCLDAWRTAAVAGLAHIEGQLEATIGGRTFEDVAVAVMTALPDAVRAVVLMPTRGHAVEVCRT